MKYIPTKVYAAVATLLRVGVVSAQSSVASSCSSTLSSAATPSVAPGYVARLVANGLTDPRGIKFDSEGALLVVESEKGITALTLEDAGGGCISESSRKTVIADQDLNHGIEISEDGRTLYSSDPGKAYSWEYDPRTQKNTSEPRTLVTNMTNSDHTTRTLLLSRSAPGMLVITRGSTSNIDALASDIETGHSQIKAFNLNNMTGSYDFHNDGLLLGWGLRNDVGIAEEPSTGRIYSVENSVDDMMRNGQDIHQTNPAEELNFLGYLDGTSSSAQGRNFGYPECYTAWDPETIPDFNNEIGEQFLIGRTNDNRDDCMCSSEEREPPVLAFHPHMAPLDILFNEAGTAAWVTFHGSWNSEPPVGYKLSVIGFENGEPVEPSTSRTAAIDILSNADVASCNDEDCFRPVGLAWDSEGRLFMSSDTTGEIYVVMRADGSATSSAGSNATGTVPQGASGTASNTGSSSSSKSASATGVASATSMSALAVIFGILAYFV
ncbi:hypothetical protein LTR37_000557 [Vermiconidia calcicola]|uniref:Uncharacterized protein n=1 Tax=Vermiconidia calcicola TaxID=1690605 RepID=A0ACC3NZ84_9PEZI|nr:hypothetical protein LTR37_000557 [Vermiconidia calcicola]